MDLDRYNKKRDFTSTTEPKGEIAESKKELIFVVQKHAASHLHYDFLFGNGWSFEKLGHPRRSLYESRRKKIGHFG